MPDVAGVGVKSAEWRCEASGEAQSYVLKFYKAFAGKAHADHLSLFDRDQRPLELRLGWADIIYVGGGNTVNMLAIWRQHGVADLLRKAYHQGTVLAGISAGANCWFEGSTTDSFGGFSPLNDGLGILPGSVCPHFQNEPQGAKSYKACVQNEHLPPGIALDDGAAAWFRDGELYEVVTSRPEASAFQGVAFQPIPTRYLGS